MIINLIDQMSDNGLKMLVASLSGLVKFLNSLYLRVLKIVGALSIVGLFKTLKICDTLL